ncbi:hypothetical protein VCHC52A1_2641, partial [Vibrio cholerae HC-52A1]
MADVQLVNFRNGRNRRDIVVG